MLPLSPLPPKSPYATSDAATSTPASGGDSKATQTAPSSTTLGSSAAKPPAAKPSSGETATRVTEASPGVVKAGAEGPKRATQAEVKSGANAGDSQGAGDAKAWYQFWK